MSCEERGEEKAVVNIPEMNEMVNTPKEYDVVNATAMGQIMETVTVGSHIAAIYG